MTFVERDDAPAGSATHPQYVGAVREITAAAKMHGKHAGFIAMVDAGARQALAQGFRLVAFGADFQRYRRALRAGRTPRAQLPAMLPRSRACCRRPR